MAPEILDFPHEHDEKVPVGARDVYWRQVVPSSCTNSRPLSIHHPYRMENCQLFLGKLMVVYSVYSYGSIITVWAKALETMEHPELCDVVDELNM